GVAVVVAGLPTPVVVPAARRATESAGRRVIGRGAADRRQVAQREDLGPVAAGDEAGAVDGAPAEAVAATIPVAVAAEGVDLARTLHVHRHPEVGEAEHVLLQAVTPVVVWLVHRVALHHDPRMH